MLKILARSEAHCPKAAREAQDLERGALALDLRLAL